jgi:hypothetical protein
MIFDTFIIIIYDFFPTVGKNIYDNILNKNYIKENFQDLNKGCFIS